MAAYARGDQRAFERLFARLAPSVHAFFLRSFRSPAVADDLLQTTFLKLHRARKEYRTDARVRPWVFTIAARVRLDELRRRYAAPADSDEEALASLADEREPGGERRLEQADVKARVKAAVDALPESQRVVVHLHRYEGMTFAEIAKALGSTEGAIKLRAFRAYERLRESLASLVEKAA
jgi:RNA polymerase sigma-70 factor (ECF subfamily)